MHDTTIIERNLTTGKRRTFNFVPYCGILIVLALLVAMLVVLGTADRAERIDALKSKYSVAPSALVTTTPKQAVPVPMKFQHVVFRVGQWEIFRFTYEEGDDTRENAHE